MKVRATRVPHFRNRPTSRTRFGSRPVPMYCRTAVRGRSRSISLFPIAPGFRCIAGGNPREPGDFRLQASVDEGTVGRAQAPRLALQCCAHQTAHARPDLFPRLLTHVEIGGQTPHDRLASQGGGALGNEPLSIGHTHQPEFRTEPVQIGSRSNACGAALRNRSQHDQLPVRSCGSNVRDQLEIHASVNDPEKAEPRRIFGFWSSGATRAARSGHLRAPHPCSRTRPAAPRSARQRRTPLACKTIVSVARSADRRGSRRVAVSGPSSRPGNSFLGAPAVVPRLPSPVAGGVAGGVPRHRSMAAPSCAVSPPNGQLVESIHAAPPRGTLQYETRVAFGNYGSLAQSAQRSHSFAWCGVV